MLDATTHTLFFYYPRVAGIPQIYRLRNEHDLERYVITHNGSPTGCHVSLYDVSARPVIDKLLFDFDHKNPYLAFEEVKCFVDELRRLKLPFVPVFSGRKGFHIYVMLRPLDLDSETAKAAIRMAQLKLIGNGNGIEFKSVDPHKIGVVRTMIRVPNTLNGSRFCTYLPPYFDELKFSEIVELATEPHHYSYETTCDRTVLDVAEVKIEECRRVVLENIEPPTVKAPSMPRFVDLIDIIRPCIYHEIQKSNPPHAVRVDFVAELMWLGHTPEQIYELCKSLKWLDFDPEITQYQIWDIFKRKMLPYSCRRLREYVKCLKCGWRYWWRDCHEGAADNGLSQEEINGHCAVCSNS